jgi:hypothetical protein
MEVLARLEERSQCIRQEISLGFQARGVPPRSRTAKNLFMMRLPIGTRMADSLPGLHFVQRPVTGTTNFSWVGRSLVLPQGASGKGL